MRSFCIANLKGGVAKSCTAINLAAIFSKDYGYRVLVVDCDSQCNTTEFLGADPAAGNLAMALRMTADPGICIQPTNIEGVDILAGSEELMDPELSNAASKELALRCLRYMAGDIAVSDRYDIVLYDCPPAFNAAFSAALLASDSVIIPIKLDAFSLRGLTNLLRQILNMRKINPKLEIDGCFVTQFYKSDATAEAWKTLKSSGLPVFNTKIRRSPKMDEMTFEQKPLALFSPTSAPCRDYRKLAEEMIGGIENGRI